MIWDILIDALRNSVLISGLVVIMMMMIESFNIESHGSFFSGLKNSRFGQVTVAALLGSVPGCMGGFATVSLYTHRMMSFGALIAMMIASSGDEAFVMLAMMPDKAVWIFLILFAVAVAVGVIVDMLYKPRKVDMLCEDGYEIHEEDHGHDEEDGHGAGAAAGSAGSARADGVHSGHHAGHRHFTWKRLLLFLGVAVFIVALVAGFLEHEHGDHHVEDAIATNLLSEQWMNVLFAVLSVIVLAVLVFGSDHFIEEHLWKHIVKKHLPPIFAWTFGVLIFIGILFHFADISGWISDNTVLMILLAAAVGIIPESGPHLIFVTLYASGVVPLPVLLASCISQDGHASIPLLAESKKSFVYAKLINFAIAILVGFVAMLF